MVFPLILRALLAAARSRPNMALPTKSIPKSFQPRAALDPLTGKPIPLTRAASGQMNPAVREFTADQVRNARLIGAAVPVGVGAAGAGVANIISSKTDAPASARPPVDTTGMSPEEAALAQQQAESDIDYRKILSRTPAVTPTERRPSFQRLAQAAVISNNPDPAKAAIGQEVLTPPSSEELLLRKMEAASRAAQPSEDLNPNENDIEAALRIARQRALESAYSRENQNRMLSDQNAFRSMEGEPGNLPLMARPDSGAASPPFNIGQAGPGGLRFGSPTTGELGNMPTSLSNYETRFSMDPRASTLPAASTAAAVRREPIDLTSNVRSAPTQEAPSFLSRLFSGTNNPVSTRELFKRSEANPDDSGAYMRAERQYAATHKDEPSYDLSKLDPATGMNRGGTAKAGNTGGGKDAALHKALEIIHHLLTRGR